MPLSCLRNTVVVVSTSRRLKSCWMMFRYSAGIWMIPFLAHICTSISVDRFVHILSMFTWSSNTSSTLSSWSYGELI